jgi:hypothetical protein
VELQNSKKNLEQGQKPEVTMATMKWGYDTWLLSRWDNYVTMHDHHG